MSTRSRRNLITDIVPGAGSGSAIHSAQRNILDGTLTQSRGEINADAYLALFCELVSYCRDRVESVMALQEKLSRLGYRIGRRSLDLIVAREKQSKRETRVLSVLNLIALSLWTFLYGKQADSLKKVRDSESECTFNRQPLRCTLISFLFFLSFFLSVHCVSPYISPYVLPIIMV